ncbi:MAG: MOSC domain-containing protein [Steroidobacteraceae bacterium]
MSEIRAATCLLGVQVGRVAPLLAGEREVMTGIVKRAVAGPVAVGPLGLDGDEQADLTVHGGLAKAVYAYPVEHYPYWSGKRRALGLDPDLAHGALGENLTVTGVLERDLYVGDVLRFAACELRVTQPRRPCYKFVAHFGDPQAARSMLETGYCGFYLAVDRPGRLSAGEAFELVPGPRDVALMTLFPSVGRRS